MTKEELLTIKKDFSKHKNDIKEMIKELKVDGLTPTEKKQIKKLKAKFIKIKEVYQEKVREYRDAVKKDKKPKKSLPKESKTTTAPKAINDNSEEGLNAQIRSLEKLAKHYVEKIEPRRAGILISQEDIAHLNKWKTAILTFQDSYSKLKDKELKDKFRTDAANAKYAISKIEEHLKNLKKDIITAENRRNTKKKNSSLSPQEQIEANPDVINQKTDRYKKKNLKDPEKKDNKNQRFLKQKGILDRKTGEYSIYEKGKNDTDDVDINDIIQGALGDCFLLSSIAAVAKANPSLIKKLIHYNNQDEYVTVTLHILQPDGSRLATKIKVDFYFPIHRLTQKFAYAKGGDGELWVMVIEKAYAKEMGGYAAIHKGGDAAEAMAVLTGKKAKQEKFTADNSATAKALQTIIDAKKYAVISTKKHTESSSKVVQVGDSFYFYLGTGKPLLQAGHAYTLIAVNKGKSSVLLRNPNSVNLQIPSSNQLEIKANKIQVLKREDLEDKSSEMTLSFTELELYCTDYTFAD